MNPKCEKPISTNLSYLDSWLAEFSNTDSMRLGADYEILATSLDLVCRSPILQTILLTCLAWFMPLHSLDAPGSLHSAARGGDVWEKVANANPIHVVTDHKSQSNVGWLVSPGLVVVTEQLKSHFPECKPIAVNVVNRSWLPYFGLFPERCIGDLLPHNLRINGVSSAGIYYQGMVLEMNDSGNQLGFVSNGPRGRIICTRERRAALIKVGISARHFVPVSESSELTVPRNLEGRRGGEEIIDAAREFLRNSGGSLSTYFPGW